jgi:heme/copper-type cytochrome/quinol oxidase subunit 2
MSLLTPEAPPVPAPGPADSGSEWRTGLLAIAVIVVAGAVVARTPAPQLAPVPSALRGVLSGLVLCVICGDAVTVMCVPREWGAAGRLLALPIGAALSGLVLTVFGLATVSLQVSLWVVLAAGVAASVVVRRRRVDRGRGAVTVSAVSQAAWLAVPLVLVIVALAPAWRHGLTTIYGENPDSHQVAGIAVLFQHVPPTGTDVTLPIDTVPSAWRFRYPIFYPLAAASDLGHLDPITAFPALAGLLLACLALGFGAFAVLCLRAPPWTGPVIAAAVGLSVSTLHQVWHPYWNQLWGLAMFPWALLFGWRLVLDGGRGIAVLFGLMLIELGLAYPLALPYPVLIVGALAVAHERYRLAPALLRSRSWVVVVLAVLVLAPAVAGAALKLGQGISQLFSSGGGLWGGDIVHNLPLGSFVGTGGGAVPALAVLVVAAAALTMLPRRSAIALGISLALLCLLDLRFRLDRQGAYMDFKHLSFVGALVLTVAASGVANWLAAGRRWALVGGGVLALAWAAPALSQGHREMLANQTQVDPELFAVRQWARDLPRQASVRVDVPPSGLQLWAVYMLSPHPVDASQPVLYTTYAHAIYGLRADYALGLRYVAGASGQVRPAPRPLFAIGRPVDRNDQFQLWRIRWPARLASIPSAASQALIEP